MRLGVESLFSGQGSVQMTEFLVWNVYRDGPSYY